MFGRPEDARSDTFSRFDAACSYCYMLARVDDTWVLERFDTRFDTSLVRFDPP
jgi:hypothetical protein